jgi:hypothetical protein
MNNKIIIIYLTIFIIIILLFSCRITNNIKENYENQTIPKIIWTFWDGEPTEFIKKCINTWQKSNSDHEIILLSKENLHHYIDNANELFSLKFADSPQHIADYVRFAVLYEYGGTWCDASIILNQNLDFIYNMKKEYYGYYLYYIEDKYPEIENWFFTVIPKSPFIKKIRDRYIEINYLYNSDDDYIQYLRENGVKLSTHPYHVNILNYLLVYCVIQEIMQKHMTPNELNNIYLADSLETGPLFYYPNVNILCNTENLKNYPIIKICGNNRGEIENSSYCLERLF